ncbi:MAG: biotin--[acetyl-CoA-carboxylase] ligase [Candidatus Eisenbacteria bacterium]|uniref:Biotin--[acetyl-CoA-carboxylase] ligase n=1 Tax=Eiseniibacteriota bacterium TaxID=2212470 RepID=A0A538TRE5_UNCEI|nr:MAG: biotin--[acetyl-CoA-carboxylase] ligase [Candidatus Eisenbacteria bacterium]
MAESTFDRHAFAGSLGTLRIGRSLYTRAEVDSTNDWAWRALASGAEDGAAFVADRQRAGRGREGRAWHTTPGKGLALSLLLTLERPPRAVGVVPLAAGLALARGIERLGLKTRLKWPNDLLVGSSKLAGILCESRRTPRGAWAVVVGVGVNVSQQREEFPREVGEQARERRARGGGALERARASVGRDGHARRRAGARGVAGAGHVLGPAGHRSQPGTGSKRHRHRAR